MRVATCPGAGSLDESMAAARTKLACKVFLDDVLEE